ncbi:hypothetical protein E0Z10_g4623 [Xylaria hypoxylon]|uniref:Uncharacterized protein n=1 Tax=Xylaria hypoxylon TaxID=37992 RepID=A0A4Z0YKN7_9PEZI|nr:hypothetical protein E0Z10_g4623 [Xylaria hypoxylon]
MLSYAPFPHREGVTLSLTPIIHNQVWDVTGGERAEYIEAMISLPGHGHTATGADRGASCRYGTLVDHEILEWVTRYGDGDSVRPKSHNPSLVPIRLLVLERQSFHPASFHIKMETYLAIEKHFALPEDTLLALSNEQGMSAHSLDIDEETGKLKRLRMVIKAHQKFQVGNYGLAFSYDFDTNVSTGILHGTGVTQYGYDYSLWSKQVAAELFEHIKAARRFWAHPLCLPTVLLQHHLLRTDYFCTITLGDQHMAVQYQLGAVRSGRLHGVQARDIAAELPVRQAKISLAELTVTMSSLMFDVIWYCSVSDWQCSCLKLLLEALTEMEDAGMASKEARLMRPKIRFLTALAESIKRSTNGMRENGQADMSVLHSIISQVDNRLSARLAASSGRDSAAMKTLAFLTALFLPGTFVATIFSTDFFNWQDSGMVVSGLFWVFWAWAVPLTIVIAVGWRLWWSFEKNRFDEDVEAEINASNGDMKSGRQKRS